ncbi:DUF5665 domain-containing protein [Candidatus Saccharibacteria bacterium]|nr:DUF5665 domain-containing protein [Candidatus Saccharibacteria bacterium]
MVENSASTEKTERVKKSSSAKKAASIKADELLADERKGLDLNERQRSAVRELFETVYMTRKWHIFGMNFLRGIAFGLGTFIGGTIVVALVVWILTRTVDIFPWAYDFVERMLDTLGR